MYMDDDVSDAYEAELEKEAKKRATLLARKQSKIEGANDHTDKGGDILRVSKCSYFGRQFLRSRMTPYSKQAPL